MRFNLLDSKEQLKVSKASTINNLSVFMNKLMSPSEIKGYMDRFVGLRTGVQLLPPLAWMTGIGPVSVSGPGTCTNESRYSGLSFSGP